MRILGFSLILGFALFSPKAGFAQNDALCPGLYSGIGSRWPSYLTEVNSPPKLGYFTAPSKGVTKRAEVVAREVEIVPGYKIYLVTMKDGREWLVDPKLDPRHARISVFNNDRPLPEAGTGIPLSTDKILLNEKSFKKHFCQMHSKLKGTKGYSDLRKLYTSGSGAANHQLRPLFEKVFRCAIVYPALAYMGGNALAEPLRAATDPNLDPELHFHSSNFIFAATGVTALNGCFKQFLPKYPAAAALLAGAGYMGVNTYEEVRIPGLDQKGHQRGGSGAVKTDLPDFLSGTLGTTAMVGTILFLSSKNVRGLRLDLFCR